MQQADEWLHELLVKLIDEPARFDETKRAIREKLLESYKNGLKAAGESPAPKRDSARGYRKREYARREP